MIQLEHISKTYDRIEHGAHHPHEVLKDVSLTINDGDVFGIIGESGAGKSTLVRCINLLETPTSGKVIINGTDITGYSGKKLAQLRQGIGMVFQSFNLFAQRSVLANVTYPLEVARKKKEERIERARKLLKVVDLSDKEGLYPSQLSGGQQQRVAIARALAAAPQVMLCDEATSALDTMTTNTILKLLKRINQDLGVTIVFITHSLAVANSICNRIAVIDGGRIVEGGSTEEVFAHPKADVTKALLSMEGRALG